MVTELSVNVTTEMSYAEALVIYKALNGKALDSDEDDIRKQIIADLQSQLFIA
jgi:hypothetical protein